MSPDNMALLLSRLIFGAIATFLAIIVWSKTRDVAWMLVVIGVIIAYCDTVFASLAEFGLAKTDILVVWGVSVIQILLANLPALFFSLAFLVIIVRRSPRRSAVPPIEPEQRRIEKKGEVTEKRRKGSRTEAMEE